MALDYVTAGSFGWDLRINFGEDMTAYAGDTLEIDLYPPSGGAAVTLSASWLNVDPSLGIMTHTVASGTVDDDGVYLAQPWIKSGSYELSGDPVDVPVVAPGRRSV